MNPGPKTGGSSDSKPDGSWEVHSDHSHGGMGTHGQASSTFSVDIGDGQTYHQTDHTYADGDGNVSSDSQSSVKDS